VLATATASHQLRVELLSFIYCYLDKVVVHPVGISSDLMMQMQMQAIPPIASIAFRDRLAGLLRLQLDIFEGCSDNDLSRRLIEVMVKVFGDAMTCDIPELQRMSLYVSISDSLVATGTISPAIKKAAAQQLFSKDSTITGTRGIPVTPYPVPPVLANGHGDYQTIPNQHVQGNMGQYAQYYYAQFLAHSQRMPPQRMPAGAGIPFHPEVVPSGANRSRNLPEVVVSTPSSAQVNATLTSGMRVKNAAWLVIPGLEPIPECMGRPDTVRVGNLLRQSVIASQDPVSTATPYVCMGDWLSLKTDTQVTGEAYALFKCKCGGLARVKAVLTGGNWVLFSKPGQPGRFHNPICGKILTAYHKEVIKDLLSDAPNTCFREVVTHLHDVCSGSYINLDPEFNFFKRQVHNHVDHVKGKLRASRNQT
jgi:hypothetical protein